MVRWRGREGQPAGGCGRGPAVLEGADLDKLEGKR